MRGHGIDWRNGWNGGDRFGLHGQEGAGGSRVRHRRDGLFYRRNRYRIIRVCGMYQLCGMHRMFCSEGIAIDLEGMSEKEE